MRKARILFALGVWVAILPYLGFPYIIKNILFAISGLGLVAISYMIYKGNKDNAAEKETFDNFQENHFTEV